MKNMGILDTRDTKGILGILGILVQVPNSALGAERKGTFFNAQLQIDSIDCAHSAHSALDISILPARCCLTDQVNPGGRSACRPRGITLPDLLSDGRSENGQYSR